MRRFVAPGRVNLIGEHTDHTDGLVLPAAIDLAITLDADLGGNRIVLRSREQPGVVDIPADGSQEPPPGWGRFIASVAAELRAAGRPPVGLRGRLRSDVPQGAGLSSSAALEVVVATALCAAAGFDLGGIDLAALCRRAEHRAVGVPSGIMDQAASVLGRAHHALLLDCSTLEHQTVPLPDELAIVVIDSGVRRQLEFVGYASRVDELRRSLPALAGRRPADVSPDELPEVLERLEAVPGHRLRHVITENARVRRAVDALEESALGELGEIFANSHASLRDDFEVSTDELDVLVRTAMDAGAVAARMTGGGFGGSIVVLADSAGADDLANEVLRGYARRFPNLQAAAYRCRAADGAREL